MKVPVHPEPQERSSAEPKVEEKNSAPRLQRRLGTAGAAVAWAAFCGSPRV